MLTEHLERYGKGVISFVKNTLPLAWGSMSRTLSGPLYGEDKSPVKFQRLHDNKISLLLSGCFSVDVPAASPSTATVAQRHWVLVTRSPAGTGGPLLTLICSHEEEVAVWRLWNPFHSYSAALWLKESRAVHGRASWEKKWVTDLPLAKSSAPPPCLIDPQRPLP